LGTKINYMKNKIIFTITFIAFALFLVSPVFADTNINLQIKTNTASIYEGGITVAPCDSEGDGVLKETPYCALVQLEESGVLTTRSDWSGLWVNSINGIINNDGGNGAYWMWLANLNIDTSPTSSYSLSSKQYILQNNDNILFYYNTNPLDVLVDNENPKVGESIIITARELGLDPSWNPVWNKAIMGKVIINGNENELDANGTFLFKIIDDSPFAIKVKKENFIDSKELIISPEKIKRSVGSIGGYIRTPVVEKPFSIDSALSFLAKNQKENGSYGEAIYTDWVSIAVGATNEDIVKSNLVKYFKENNLVSDLITDNQRRAMALMAQGISPYDGTSINYINKIIDGFDGTQFGRPELINDDIFALIVLKNSGYLANDEVILKTINYIITKQLENGSWGGVDITAASIQALRNFLEIEKVTEAIQKAEEYLISTQENDGGFGNSFSTSWVLQALSHNNQIKKAEKYLASKQETDGGVGGIEEEISNRIWATSYAIPAILNKSWDEILIDFPKLIEKEDPIIIKKEEIKEKKIIKSIKVSENKKENLKLSEKTEQKEENQTQIEKNMIKKKNIVSSTFSHLWKKIKSPFIWLFE